MKLQLAKDLSLPIEVSTEALAWVGARGSGKTHGAGKLVELLFSQGVPVVVLDPVGVWYGLRLAKDGKGRGLSIPVFGGLHGDVPLEPTAGALIADLIVDRNLSAVLDVSQFETDAQKARFAADFAERLFQRKKKDPAVIHFVVDEAQEFVPQNPMPGEQMMLHRFHRLIKLGRNFGIGVSLLTQRPQETSKKVLNQCQTVLAFRLTGSHERKAMKEWIAAQDLDQALVERLPNLETGNCHIWSPAFLKLSKEIRILPKETFDASATPKFGERRAACELAPIDIEKIRKDMAATIEKVKAEDPKELRRQINDLKAQLLAKVPIQVHAAKEKIVRVKDPRPLMTEAMAKRIDAAAEKANKAHLGLSKLVDQMVTLAAKSGAYEFKTLSVEDQINSFGNMKNLRRKIETQLCAPRETPKTFRGIKAFVSPGELISGPQQKILDALAWMESVRVETVKRSIVAVLAEQSSKSSGFKNNLSLLRTAGLITYPDGDSAQLTDAGRSAATPATRPATTEELQSRVLARLPGPQMKILRELIEQYPKIVPRDWIAERTDQSPKSSGYKNNLSLLRTMGMIEYPDGGTAKAASLLFLDPVPA